MQHGTNVELECKNIYKLITHILQSKVLPTNEMIPEIGFFNQSSDIVFHVSCVCADVIPWDVISG